MPNLDRAVANTVVWAELASPDLDGARAFYGELLGWTFKGDADPNSGYYTMAQRNGRNVAALYKKSADMQGPPAWCIYFGSNDVDQTARKVSEAAGRTIMQPMDVMEYGRMGMFADPTGAVFGVWQAKQHQGIQLFGEPGALAWSEVYSRDGKRACSFYASVFGLDVQKLDAPNIDYWTLHQRGDTVCGVMHMTDQFPKDEPSHWNTYFAVSDPDASSAKLEKLGGKVLQPAFDTPYGRMAAVTDPWGAGFCLIKPSNPG